MSVPIEKGRKIGQYEIIEPIGKGGMASVFRAYQRSLDREVAIKLMAELYAADASFVERFRREARSIARLRHPNILTVYDAGEDDGLLYIVMELVDGPTLKDEINGKPMPVDKAIGYITQVAGALDYANKNGIIHRDVKPSNVLLEKSGRAVLADFGIAKLAEQNNQLTSTGTGVGTPDYMSPEQALGEELDARSDEYSLGVMLYELLTGRTPYTGDTPIAVVMGHVSKPLPSPRQFNPQIPETVEAVLAKALSKKAVDRYESSAAFSEALQEAWRNRNAAPAATSAKDGDDEPTVAVGVVPRQESGPYNPEAERLYNEARRLEQQNNFHGAFALFNQLNNRYPRYRDVPTILDRYRTMGYGQAQATGWQAVQNQPGLSGHYSSYAGQGSGQFPAGTGYTPAPANRQYTPAPTNRQAPAQPTGAPPSFANQSSAPFVPGGTYQPAAAPPARKSFPLLPVLIGIIGLAAAAIVLLLVLAGGAAKTPTPTPGVAVNPTAAPVTTSNARPTTSGPRPTLTIALPTRRPVITPAATSGTNANLRYVTYREPGGLWSAEVPEDWEASQESDGITFTSKRDTNTALTVLSEDLGSGGGALGQPLIEGLVKQYLENYGAKIDREEKRRVDGIDSTIYHGSFESSGVKLNMKLVSVAKNDRVFLILLATNPAAGNVADRLFDRFLSSLKIR